MIRAESPDAVIVVDRELIGITLLFVCSLVALAAAGLLNAAQWIRHGEITAVVAYAAAAAIALVWGCTRAWRMQLRIDEHGVTIRNFFRTHRIGWQDVSRFEDGSRWGGAEGPLWALRVVCIDGRSVISAMTSLGGWRAARRREKLIDAIQQAAAVHGKLAHLTGGVRPAPI